MKWAARGLIFDPAAHELPLRSVGFAQSPQALVLPDRVRVFFSTRERDATGKYLSHVAFVDFDRGMQRILGVNLEPVIALGGLGCFDEHGIFPMHVFDDGDRVLAYTTGWNRKVSVSADAAIGLAISRDGGTSFQKHGTGPVMAATLNEPFLIGDAFVVRHAGTYHMWYIFGQRWVRQTEGHAPDRVYKIAHATSADGIAWRRDGRTMIPDRLDADECQALPTVIRIDARWHMFFCYRAAFGFRDQPGAGYRLGHAVSDDLEHWQRDDAAAAVEPSADGWDSQMQCYPHVFECDGSITMLYNGNEFGRHGFGMAVLER
jgi:predicted GH43/DUF377 family glycosyl hydrolase